MQASGARGTRSAVRGVSLWRTLRKSAIVNVLTARGLGGKMAANDGDKLLAGTDRDAFASEPRARLRPRSDATVPAAVLAVAALVLVGCARRAEPPQPDRPVGHPPSVSVIPPPARLRPGPVIPWRPAPPVKQRPTLTVPRCRGAVMRTELTWQGLRQDAVTGTVQLVNGGAVDCSLPVSPYPSFELLDGRGTLLPVTQSPWPRPPPPPHPSQVVLRPGGGVIAEVSWFNWCRPAPRAVAIRLPLSAGPQPQTSTSAPVVVTPPPCGQPGQPSMRDGKAFTLARPAAGTMYGDATSLDLRLQVPRSVTVGAPLHYRVTLANRGTWIVPLRPCPNYTVTVNLLGPGGQWTVHHKHRYGLSCGVLGGALHPGEQATFELVAIIPADAHPGHSLLTWMIEGHDGSSGTEAEFRVGKRA
jgi:hypothetical protein